MKTLCQLVLQYKSDVERGIKCIKDEWWNEISNNEDVVNDYHQQIAHWEATLAEINETIENGHLDFELDNPEVESEDS